MLLAVVSNGSRATPIDLWDATHGTVVTSASPTDDFYNTHINNATQMFIPKVNVARPFEDDSKNTLFGDKQPAGFVHYVEWETPTPVTIGSFQFFTVDDHPSFNRSLDHFTLYAWNGTAFQPIFSSDTAHPYIYDDPAHVLLFDETVNPITSDRFRAEFTQNGTIVDAYMGRTTYGPRILELAAFAPVPLPAGACMGAFGAALLPLYRRFLRR
jgi:hypothetical protein